MRSHKTVTATALLLLAGCTSLKRCAYEGFGRDERQKPEEVIRALAIEPGAHIADLGSGSGYFTFRLAEAAGSGGIVYATDVDASMNEYLAAEVEERGVENVTIIEAEPDDPKLPSGGIDLVFTSNTYHHIEDRIAYFRNLQQVLAPGGRVAIIDYHADANLMASLFSHSTPAATIRTEMAAAGYEVQDDLAILSEQTFVVFVPESPG